MCLQKQTAVIRRQTKLAVERSETRIPQGYVQRNAYHQPLDKSKFEIQISSSGITQINLARTDIDVRLPRLLGQENKKNLKDSGKAIDFFSVCAIIQ